MREKLLATLASLGLFLAGWFIVEKEPLRTNPNEALAVVRPAQGLIYVEGEEYKAVESGETSVPLNAALKYEREHWEESSTSLSGNELLALLRCKPPKSKFDPVTKNKKPVKLKNLATEKELKRDGAVYRLAAGPYEFLAEAEGHIPDKLSVELKPGELRKMEVALKLIPTFIPPELPVRPTLPTPPPTYRPPPVRPRPRPRPRFTPIAKPQPPPYQPVPMFTPLP